MSENIKEFKINKKTLSLYKISEMYYIRMDEDTNNMYFFLHETKDFDEAEFIFDEFQKVYEYIGNL